MCEIHTMVRAFILRPHKLGKEGNFLRGIGLELERLQAGFDNMLEIVFLTTGGFAICITDDFPEGDMLDATEYLKDFLDIPPRLVDLSQLH